MARSVMAAPARVWLRIRCRCPAFQTWVRNGTPGWSVASGMPAFPATVITDQELADVRAFLASLPAPPAVKDIPLLNP